MARKKRQQAQGATKPVPPTINVNIPKVPTAAAAPEDPPTVQLAFTEASSSRPAAEIESSSTSSKVVAECAAILRDINRGARWVFSACTYHLIPSSAESLSVDIYSH